MMDPRSLILPVVFAGLGCVGTTGGDLLTFSAFAAGPESATPGEPYEFVSGRGYQVSLTRARLHVGAVYLNRAVPTSVSSDTSCTLAGIYVAEVTTGLDVDALSPALQPFPVEGFATTERARTGELWLTGGNIDDESDTTVILDVAGTAEKDGEVFPFEGTITIGKNRVATPPDPALPGAKPICKQRVVTPIAADITPTPGGHLVLRVDPAGWFGNVDFSRLADAPGATPPYQFADDSSDQPSKNLYGGLRAAPGAYSLRWEQ